MLLNPDLLDNYHLRYFQEASVSKPGELIGILQELERHFFARTITLEYEYVYEPLYLLLSA